ncbi:dTDP-4-amino-4,6-dideoxyglucose formyltransferase [Pseudoalteromonas sp. 5-MNA-CIBAN-0065]|uniref:dTDP-4-amino-4,6-dideoxyglucose formyltransferase n=1 Tax=Pseudoalteromonas sp. 5-MNA-CIBAN-0065 TaxID=3140421 RepID=UPI0033290395|tara:strand:- start:7479 stop:8198 length:720 start_codon:yes stop_codon:yes gene_type:complete
MNKILVISDNLELVAFIQDITQDKATYSVDYNYSAINKAPSLLKKLGMTAINVKDELTVDLILEKYDVVISAHCKQIFPKRLVENIRCINIHPGLNPYNRGWFPQVFSIINKLPIGCTIHEMDEEIDHGSIIYQKSVSITPSDGSLEVYNKVLEAEKFLISRYFDNLISGNYELVKVETEGNYNGIEDFHALCELDLTNTATLSEHLDLLRALTHGEFKNGYFQDGDKKYFVKLEITSE